MCCRCAPYFFFSYVLPPICSIRASPCLADAFLPRMTGWTEAIAAAPRESLHIEERGKSALEIPPTTLHVNRAIAIPVGWECLCSRVSLESSASCACAKLWRVSEVEQVSARTQPGLQNSCDRLCWTERELALVTTVFVFHTVASGGQ